MPFIQSQNTVVQKEILPEITTKEQSDKLPLSSLVILQGGQGGSFGEKSYKPKVILADADIVSLDNPLDSIKIFKYSTTEIKSENDCGYAIDFRIDGSNQCDFNIGEYNPYDNLNIYAASQILPFSDLYTGGVSSSTPLSHGDAIGSFTLITDPGAPWYLTPTLDTELNLNKYYLELRNSSSIEDAFYLQKSINFSDVNTSVFVFYVTQTDLVSGYATYNTGVINYNASTNTNITGGFFDTIFNVGDIIYISHPSGYYGVQAEIIAKNGTTNHYTFNIEKSNNIPPQTVSFPVGSSVSIIDEISSNKLSIWNENPPSNIDLYNDLYSNVNYGIQYNIAKKVTTNHKELFNSVFFNADKKLFSDQASPQIIQASFERISNRTYMQDQYGTDVVKNQIKNKSKFNIFYHGFERLISKNNTDTTQAVTTYSCGSDTSPFVSQAQVNQDVIGSLQQAGKTVKLIVGSPIKKMTGLATRCYYSNKIYEVLVYIDLKSSDIEKVLIGLSKKYSQKTSFSSPVEFQSTDMYYSKTDKINILGKIKKTST